MKKPIIAAAMVLLAPTAGFALEASGHITAGAQMVDTDTNSSKFNEYRDIKDGLYLYDLGVKAETGTGYFLGAKGSNVGRDDQNILLQGGRYGRWGATLEWDEIIHNLSNKARTPYINEGGGRYTVPATVPLTAAGRSLTPSRDNLRANDLLTAAYLDANVHPVRLGNDRKKGVAGFDFSLIENLKLRLTVSNEDREGNKVSYGPIGDRPPRSTNIQFEEPIDYRTQEAKLEADYTGRFYQANFTYLVSKFENNIDTLTWQNIYSDADPTGTQTFQTWTDGRQVANFGRRALPQDNLYQNAGLTLGVNLPLNSRLTAAASYGLAKQDETLIPYSTNGTVDSVGDGLTGAPVINGLAWNDPAKLPRNSADAEIETKLFNLDYTINPIQRLNLRAYYRYYDLANNTPTEDWRYVTSDTTNGNGSVAYVNKRSNLAYEYDKQNYGVDANYSLPLWASTLGLAYGREETDRAFREAGTDENIYRVSLRSRPANWLSFRTKYQYGDRQADGYESEAGNATFWYVPAEAGTSNTDSQFSFINHPDTRRYDVTDRERNLFDFQVTASPAETVDVSASYRYRKDDYDSNVQRSQPLLNYVGARPVTADDRIAFTPGDQIGLLEDEQKFYGLDVAYTPNQRLRFSAFASREESNSLQRGLEYNENNKVNPSALDAAEFGPWTRKNSQWTADIKDTTYTVGIDAGVVVVPKKLNFGTNYTYSAGKVEIGYAGYGAVSALDPTLALADTHEFGFRSPPAVRNNRHTVSANVEYQVVENLTLALGYMFEYFKIKDWQQEANTPWAESVAGNELMLRDTSATGAQWGNRLPNLGSYLAPSYEAHVVSIGATYKF